MEPEGGRRAEASFDQSTSPSGEDKPLSIGVEFELQTETQVVPKDEQAIEETAPLSPHQNESLDEQQANVDRNCATWIRKGVAVATVAELERAIDAMLDHPLGVQQYQLARTVEGKVYEAYVFTLCLRAVRELGVTPMLRGVQGAPNPFIFRGAPGQIHSISRNYGYAVFLLNGNPFEIHAGVEFWGTSGMTHELDVCIMRGDDATCGHAHE